MKRVRFPPPAPVFIENADMAQLVERTLGKGEVGSSNLPISTISRFLLYNSSLLFIFLASFLYNSNSASIINLTLKITFFTLRSNINV